MSQQPDNNDPEITVGSSSNVGDATQHFGPNNSSQSVAKVADTGGLPKSFGRYRVVALLGKGGFGAVYRAVDEQLDRDVAIKVTLGSLLDPSLRKNFLTEARIVAALDHPNIVPVYDVGQTDGGDFFVVSKLIEGGDLSSRIKLDRPDRLLSLRIVEQIAEALHHAHAKGLVHRDVKPGNILLDRHERSYLTDFGLALRETELRREGESSGTPAYMSPEQARGEGHRIDHRSDIYSLGIVLYELLTGRRPFRSDNALELMKLVATEEVRSPRLFEDTISPDLERICMKALARRASDRFTVARDFADEIRWLLTQHAPTPGLRSSTVLSPASSSPITPITPMTAGQAAPVTDATPTGPTRIVPKGLRSFDASDAGFFLELLPGPFDRDGLPESLRFWKTRIEETDPEKTFKVGLVYGPSGCGKSSLMKAGLLPRLTSKIIRIYLEATPDDTETRVLRAVRKAIPDAEGASLKEVLSVIRRRKLVPSGGKLLLVLDQFEQWLFAEEDYAKASLTDALLQCDGGSIQALVMVRDDFWLSVSRFLRELDIPILERENSGLVDLFDLDHATKVLGLFGKAYGKLPDSTKNWNQDQNEFVREAIQGLSQDRKVISVRIALLADMMKSRDWTTATLREVGGIDGIGVTFLEEMFGSRQAPLQHRQHQEAVRGLLSTLLPRAGTDIKGFMQSAATLQKAAGYEQKPREFEDLLSILDQNLRLITPVDDSSGAESGSTRSYQLAHDYMVPSLREWLTQKQRETKKGRSELRLAERAAAWSLNPESKQLPRLIEWWQIRRLTEPAKWKASEKAVMQRATGYHLQRMSLTAAALVLFSIIGLITWREVALRQEAIRIEGLVSTLTSAEPAQIPEIVKQLDANAEIADPLLAPLAAADAATPTEQRARMHARLARVSRDSALVEPLTEELLTGKVNYVLPIRQLLRPSAEKITGTLRTLLSDERAEPQRRFRAALALAEYVPVEDLELWTESNRSFVVQQLMVSNAESQPVLREALRPIQSLLLSNIEKVFSDAAASDTVRMSAANALADYAAEDQTRLTQLLTVATPEQYKVIYPLVSAAPTPEMIAQLSEVASKLPPEDLGSVPRIAYGQRRANAAVALLNLGEPEKALAVFEWSDDPEALTQFIFRCQPRGIRIKTLLDLLEVVAISPAKYPKDTRYALLLAIGEYGPSEIPATRRDALVKRLGDWYANDPSSGVHGAAGWLLRYLGEKDIADKVDRTPVAYSPGREWFTLAIEVNPAQLPQAKSEDEAGEESSEKKEERININKAESQQREMPPEPLRTKKFYYTFIVYQSGEFTIGSMDDEVARNKKNEARHVVKLTRPFALLDREITFEELAAFSPLYARYMKDFDASPTDAGLGVDWYDSVSFCRWLGEELGLPEVDQCYPDPKTVDTVQYPREPNPQANWAVRDWPLYLNRRGFRLPTESEWEVAVRGGSRTAYGFGSEVALLERFSWFTENSGNKVHTGREKRPSVRGFFDLHGNLFEWTHDFYGDFGVSLEEDPLGARTGSDRVIRGGGWDTIAESCRTASRAYSSPTYRRTSNGLRLALVPSR